MRRREFLGVLGSLIAWPVVAGAQQPGRMRRIGVLMHTTPDEPESQVRLAAFLFSLFEAPTTMKVRSSLKSLKTRHRDCKVVRRKGRVYVINKTDPRFKAKQG